MPQKIEFTPVEIIIEIPDIMIDDTIVKRKAKLFTMTYNQHAQYLTLTWIVSYFANVAGEYGEALSMFDSFSQETIADNATIVDVATGAILPPIVTPTETTDADGVTTTIDVVTYASDYIGQYDWFNMLAESQPLKVHDLIRQYGASVPLWHKK